MLHFNNTAITQRRRGPAASLLDTCHVCVCVSMRVCVCMCRCRRMRLAEWHPSGKSITANVKMMHAGGLQANSDTAWVRAHSEVSNVLSLHCLVPTPISTSSSSSSTSTLSVCCLLPRFSALIISSPHTCLCPVVNLSPPCCVTAMGLPNILIFKRPIRDFWSALTTAINANHLGMVCQHGGIHIHVAGRQWGLCNHGENVLPAGWALPPNCVSTQNGGAEHDQGGARLRLWKVSVKRW